MTTIDETLERLRELLSRRAHNLNPSNHHPRTSQFAIGLIVDQIDREIAELVPTLLDDHARLREALATCESFDAPVELQLERGETRRLRAENDKLTSDFCELRAWSPRSEFVAAEIMAKALEADGLRAENEALRGLLHEMIEHALGGYTLALKANKDAARATLEGKAG